MFMSQLPMTAIRLSSKHPVPPARGGKYPWGSMEVGHSFHLEGGRAAQASILSTAKSWSRRHNKKARFTTRKEGRGFRVYRIK